MTFNMECHSDLLNICEDSVLYGKVGTQQWSMQPYTTLTDIKTILSK